MPFELLLVNPIEHVADNAGIKIGLRIQLENVLLLTIQDADENVEVTEDGELDGLLKETSLALRHRDLLPQFVLNWVGPHIWFGHLVTKSVNFVGNYYNS